jgi:hypothetical protein
MAAKYTTMWKCKDVETPGEPGRIRKRLFIDLENDDKTSDNQPSPSKKAKRDADQQKQEPLLREHLGRKWYLVITVFQGETKVHLRVYEQRQEDGTLYPTRKGIALDLEKWKKLSELCREDIDAAIEHHEAEMPVSYKKTFRRKFLCHRRNWVCLGQHKEMVDASK